MSDTMIQLNEETPKRLVRTNTLEFYNSSVLKVI